MFNLHIGAEISHHNSQNKHHENKENVSEKDGIVFRKEVGNFVLLAKNPMDKRSKVQRPLNLITYLSSLSFFATLSPNLFTSRVTESSILVANLKRIIVKI